MPRPHIVIVDGYEGMLEYGSGDPGRAILAAALGLPLDDLVEGLDCAVTLLDWREWRAYEARWDSFARWMPYPATRPTEWPDTPPDHPIGDFPGVARQSVRAHDPDHGRPLAEGLSPLTYGLLANSDPLFLASYLLNRHLEALHRDRPIDLLILPGWTGAGYVAQMSRATEAGLRDVRVAVTVTDTSLARQSGNLEGLWTRPAITRRQMEDLSLALADLLICHGPRGEAIARQRAPGTPIVRAPRRLGSDLIEAIAAAADAPGRPHRLILGEPLQPVSGALATLDAAQLLRRRGMRPQEPIAAPGRNMLFAPQKPRDFRGYWSSRGWVRELVEQGWWAWDDRGGDASESIALHPTLFDHLPDVWHDFTSGALPMVSPAAAEGLVLDDGLPAEILIGADPDARTVADAVARMIELPGARRDDIRRRLCERVAASHRGPAREAMARGFVDAVKTLLREPSRRAGLSGAARLLLDRRLPLADIAEPPLRARPAAQEPPTLTVAVMCYEMGDLLVETIHSVWQAKRQPDELIIVDDGSTGAATAAAIDRLEQEAAAAKHLLRIVRQGNRGLAGARNAALETATGRYISFLDGDDLIEPDFYALAIDLLEAEPGIGGVAAWAVSFGEGVSPGFWNAPQPELPLLLVENTVFVPLMMPTALLRDLGGYDERQRFNYEDWELPIRMLSQGWPIVTIPRYMQRYRVRGDSLLRTMSDVQNQVMRELLMTRHRTTIARFGPEVAMQLEHQLLRSKEENEMLRARTQEPASPPNSISRLRSAAARRLGGGLGRLKTLSRTS